MKEIGERKNRTKRNEVESLENQVSACERGERK